MKKTDPDYEEKKRKFDGCNKIIDTDECSEWCDGCKFDLTAEDFTYFLIHENDES